MSLGVRGKHQSGTVGNADSEGAAVKGHPGLVAVFANLDDEVSEAL
jgi:hypothetical protein